ncbi:2-hydroxychromene-2-carboxylate isomerase [Cognatilysobacter bugurensis]|uniref:2-hydroxychromene-2-carboxylate isomerase n=1 Tax=Cognatilysobacter bugurensis TaxID=543356 RepID=A0A918T353_9GAMM|nr:2-hydroxychromene-2-carboxylate isomerase [Lysobacter bugurensis]GHA83515.1 isomerase [Lysobacter bugurensis]
MTLDWYFDFLSPFAYLQWPRVRALRRQHPIALRPVLLGALLAHHGQRGPAEIAAKRRFTYRHVQWQADRAGVPLVFPDAHPFNPLPALRLCLHADASEDAIDALFDHVWRHGSRADDAASLAPVAAGLGIEDLDAALIDPHAKAALRANTERAIVQGVFGVPTLAIDDERGPELYWGVDATAMFEQRLADPAYFASEAMQRLDALPIAARREM